MKDFKIFHSLTKNTERPCKRKAINSFGQCQNHPPHVIWATFPLFAATKLTLFYYVELSENYNSIRIHCVNDANKHIYSDDINPKTHNFVNKYYKWCEENLLLWECRICRIYETVRYAGFVGM